MKVSRWRADELGMEDHVAEATTAEHVERRRSALLRAAAPHDRAAQVEADAAVFLGRRGAAAAAAHHELARERQVLLAANDRRRADAVGADLAG